MAAAGKWRVRYVRVSDLQGNTRTYQTQELVDNGWQTEFSVLSGLCYASPWLCIDPKADPSAVAPIEDSLPYVCDPAEIAMKTCHPSNEPYWNLTRPIYNNMPENGFSLGDGSLVESLQQLNAQDDRMDSRQGWLYYYYRYNWNDEKKIFEQFA